MYDVIYIDADGSEEPVASHLERVARDAALAAKHGGAERGAGRHDAAGLAAPAAELRLRRAGPQGRVALRAAAAGAAPLASRPMRIGVVGGGLMGSGIAEVCARAGVDVTVVEADADAVARAQARIEKSLDRGVRSGKLSADGPRGGRRPARLQRDARRPRGLGRGDRGDHRERAGEARAVPAARQGAAGRRVPRLEHLLGADHEARRGHLAAGARARPALLQPGAGAAARRGRAVDHDRRRGAGARAELRRGHARARSASTRRTAPGSWSTRCSCPYLLSSIRMYESGFASKEDIDEGMIKGCAHPMGPLALSDLIGLDTLLAVSRVALRRVPRSGVGRAGAAQPDGRGGPARAQERPRVLRLLELVAPRRRRSARSSRRRTAGIEGRVPGGRRLRMRCVAS